MKLKEIVWRKYRDTSYAYLGNRTIGMIRRVIFTGEFHCKIYILNIDIDENFTTEEEAKAVMESKIKEWFEHVTE